MCPLYIGKFLKLNMYIITSCIIPFQNLGIFVVVNRIIMRVLSYFWEWYIKREGPIS